MYCIEVNTHSSAEIVIRDGQTEVAPEGGSLESRNTVFTTTRERRRSNSTSGSTETTKEYDRTTRRTLTVTETVSSGGNSSYREELALDEEVDKSEEDKTDYSDKRQKGQA